MNSTQKTSLGIVIVLGAMLSFSGLFTVLEGQNAIVLRFGQIVQDVNQQPRVYRAGLHFKWPLLESVRRFDVRLRSFDVQSSRILTQRQKYVLVDYYVKWQVEDLPLYFKRTGGYKIAAERLLQQKINNALRAAFGERTIAEVVSDERLKVMRLLLTKADQSAKSLGVKVVDVRIKRIDLPKEVSKSVYQRMSTEREQVATKHRSDGKAEAESLRAKADAQAQVIVATARAQGAQLRADGDAQAARVYAVYHADPTFFNLWRSLTAYQSTFSEKDLVVIGPDAPFFKAWKTG